MAYEAYIVSNDYTTTYNGSPIDSTSFDRIALRASDEIDKLTFNEIRRAGLSAYSEAIQEQIKLATCAIAEGLATIDTATEGTGVVTTSEKVGPYSYSVDADSLKKVMENAIEKAESFLLFTGLLYRGI